MHISEGILHAPALLAGAALTAVGVYIGVKKLDYDKIPQAAILAAAFFVASLIRVPLGPSSVHLVLNGLLGALLGWVAFPVILVALALQALLFQFGGLTTLGVNTFAMAFPAVVCGLVCKKMLFSSNQALAWVGAFTCGAGAVLLAAVLVALALYSTGEQFLEAAWSLVLMNLPVVALEGVITVFAVGFLKKVKPELYEKAYA